MPEECLDDITEKNIAKASKIEEAHKKERSLGQKIADGFATSVGSWTFIIIQSVILALWIAANVYFTKHVQSGIKPWDAYPFILLNLTLSFQAAYTGPILLMSSNRQTRLSEERKALDMQVNLLAEEESTLTLKILCKMAEKLGVDLDEDSVDIKALQEKVGVEKLQKKVQKMDL
jgi:uncharacterized membrane protein